MSGTRLDTGDPSLAHLKNRLALVEARVRAAVVDRRGDGGPADDAFRGLYLSDEHVDRLLEAPTGADPGDGWVAQFDAIEKEADEAQASGAVLRLRRLAGAFNVDAVDVELLLVAMAPDVDARFESLYGYLHDDVTRRRATVGLALSLCRLSSESASARRRLRAGSALIAGGLLVVEDSERPFLSRSLRVPDRVTMYLLGDDEPDPEIVALLARCPPCLAGDPDGLAAAISKGAQLCYLREQGNSVGRSLGAAAYQRLGMASLALDLSRAAADADFEVLARVASREARLAWAALIVGPVECLVEKGSPSVRTFAELHWPVVLTGGRSWDPAWSRTVPLLVDVPQEGPDHQAQVWRTVLDGDAPPDFDPAQVTAAFRLTADQIDRAATAATLRAALEGRPLETDDLTAGARAQNAGGLERLAQRIEPTVGFSDLVLPPDVMDLLFELQARARHRHTVLDDWGLRRTGRRGDGITALFAGPPGTGKTMAAEVLARELGLELYVVDLATVVDKYIGETEKNLDRIFTEAERVNGILLFDEADALFGKRSEVRDAHDRYANVEVAYLLQRMETFTGIAILTTNLRSNLDDAFSRRLDGVVDFPMPDRDGRFELWRRCLGPPVPLDDDVDLAFCAKAFELSGGNIRNVALAAAFYAADTEPPVRMQDIIRAVTREYQKLGRLCTEEEFGEYLPYVKGDPATGALGTP